MRRQVQVFYSSNRPAEREVQFQVGHLVAKVMQTATAIQKVLDGRLRADQFYHFDQRILDVCPLEEGHANF
jgi:hypothetical protein